MMHEDEDDDENEDEQENINIGAVQCWQPKNEATRVERQSQTQRRSI
jgi:hypothetical protein